MTEQCLHVDGSANRCQLDRGHEQEIGRPGWTGQPNHLFVPRSEPTPVETLRRVQPSDLTSFRWCRGCQETMTHRSHCSVYVSKLEDKLDKETRHREAVKKAHAAYVKENPSRPEIRRILDRRAAHIRDLQAAGTRRNQQIEHLERELERERGRVNSAPSNARLQQVERLEAENFVLSNEVEKLGKRIHILELEKQVLEDEKGVLKQALETYVADLEQQTADSERDQDILTQRIRELESANHSLLDSELRLKRSVERLQEEVATQNSWDMREADESSLLEELQRRARQRETQ